VLSYMTDGTLSAMLMGHLNGRMGNFQLPTQHPELNSSYHKPFVPKKAVSLDFHFCKLDPHRFLCFR
jgi:hypothetical protein